MISELSKKIKLTYPNLAMFTLALELEHYFAGCDSILDLGCGSNSPIRFIAPRKLTVGVDIHKASLTKSAKAKIHTKYKQSDVDKAVRAYTRGEFDAVIALDLIEHLPKKAGLDLLRGMEKVAKKKVIVLTPNGYIDQHDDENKYQAHLSGWRPTDFTKRGYKVYGRYGLPIFRGEKAALRARPKWFWGLISEASNWVFSRYFPKYSFSLLCVKTVGK